MGSFSKLVMAFKFRDDTPDEVLAAFSALERPLGPGAPFGPAPALPAPNVEPVDIWEPDYEEAGWEDPDPLANEPWRHEWHPTSVDSSAKIGLRLRRWTGGRAGTSSAGRCSSAAQPQLAIFWRGSGPSSTRTSRRTGRSSLGTSSTSTNLALGCFGGATASSPWRTSTRTTGDAVGTC